MVVVLVMLYRHGDLATGVRATHPAHPVWAARAMAARAHAQRGRNDFVLRAALGGAAVRLLLLGDGHWTGKASSHGRRAGGPSKPESAPPAPRTPQGWRELSQGEVRVGPVGRYSNFSSRSFAQRGSGSRSW